MIGQADNAHDLVELVDRNPPDVAVIDIKMPPTHTDEGLVAAQTIRSNHPHVAVLLLSHYVEPTYALRLLDTLPRARARLPVEGPRLPQPLCWTRCAEYPKVSVCIDPTIVSSLLGRQRVNNPLAGLALASVRCSRSSLRVSRTSRSHGSSS